MQFEGALIKEQGVTFGILVVKKSVLDSISRRQEALVSGAQIFGHNPTVLMAQDGRGVPTYYGRKDIVGFLSRLPISAIPWKRYTIA